MPGKTSILFSDIVEMILEGLYIYLSPRISLLTLLLYYSYCYLYYRICENIVLS